MNHTAPEAWNLADAYERYVGRWSRRVAEVFIGWLSPERERDWADVGCGTGALAAALLAGAAPRYVVGADRSTDLVANARRQVGEPRASFVVGDATQLPWPSASVDYAVSGLVLNFVPEHQAMRPKCGASPAPAARLRSTCGTTPTACK